MATLDDVLNEIGRHENGGVRPAGPMTAHAIAQSDRLDSVLADCARYERSSEFGDRVSRKDEHIGWGPMVRKLEGEGHSKTSAEKIAGYINQRKNG